MAIKLASAQFSDAGFLPGHARDVNPTRLDTSDPRNAGWALHMADGSDSGTPAQGLPPGFLAISWDSKLVTIVAPGGWVMCSVASHAEVMEIKKTAAQKASDAEAAKALELAGEKAKLAKAEADRQMTMQKDELERKARATGAMKQR